jgi:hypothetical protein
VVDYGRVLPNMVINGKLGRTVAEVGSRQWLKMNTILFFFIFFFAPKREKYFERIIFIAFPFIEE